MIYLYKKSLFDSNTKITVTENFILIEGKSSEKIFYDDIKKIYLFKTPSFRGLPEQYFCKIQCQNNKKLQLGNQSFVKPLTWKDKSFEYKDFIKELHSKLYRKPIEFELGNGKSNYALFLGFLIIGIISFIIISVGAFINNKLEVAITMGLISIIFAVLTPGFVKGYKSGSYNSQQIPEYILP